MNPIMSARNLLLAVLLSPALGWAQPQVHPLYFATGDFGDEHGVAVAVLTTATIDGRSCSVQIDTGFNGAVAWHVDTQAAGTRDVQVELGALRGTYSASDQARALLDGCRIGNPVATLGNAFFESGSIEIDFAAPRLTVDDGALLAASSTAQPFRYARWGTVGGHVLVQAAGPRSLPKEALLDTGSLRIDLGVHDRSSWEALAESSPSAADTFPVHAWGRQHRCHRTLAKESVRFGSESARRPALTYCPTLPFEPGEPILGILGMRSFLGSRIVIDYRSRRWQATGGALSFHDSIRP